MRIEILVSFAAPPEEHLAGGEDVNVDGNVGPRPDRPPLTVVPRLAGGRSCGENQSGQENETEYSPGSPQILRIIRDHCARPFLGPETGASTAVQMTLGMSGT